VARRKRALPRAQRAGTLSDLASGLSQRRTRKRHRGGAPATARATPRTPPRVEPGSSRSPVPSRSPGPSGAARSARPRPLGDDVPAEAVAEVDDGTHDREGIGVGSVSARVRGRSGRSSPRRPAGAGGS
jgi:hypothetical protein